MIQVGCHFHDIDREFDIHVAFDLSPSRGVGKLFRRLGDQCEAVVVQPVHKWADRRILLVFDESGIIYRPNNPSLCREMVSQAFVINIETKRASGGIHIGPINEQRNTFVRVKCHLQEFL